MSDTANIYSGTQDNDTMGGRLLRARDAAGLTIAELAARLGVKKSTVQAWENDRSQPHANRLSTMAGVLNVSLSWLLHGVGNGPSEDGRNEIIESMALQLDRLQRLQTETQRLATRLQSDIKRFTDEQNAS